MCGQRQKKRRGPDKTKRNSKQKLGKLKQTRKARDLAYTKEQQKQQISRRVFGIAKQNQHRYRTLAKPTQKTRKQILTGVKQNPPKTKKRKGPRQNQKEQRPNHRGLTRQHRKIQQKTKGTEATTKQRQKKQGGALANTKYNEQQQEIQIKSTDQEERFFV